MKKVIFAMAIGGVLSVSAFAASCDDPMLKGLIEGLNKSVPQRVDFVTTLKKAECANGSLKYVYELNDAEGIELSKFDKQQKDTFDNVQIGILKQTYCTQMKPLQPHTNSVIWTYEMGGKKFAEFEFKPSDCK